MRENKVQQFLNETFGEVRTVMIDSEIWFVAKDVASALGYSVATDMTRNLDEDEKDMQTLHTLGGNQKLTIINESGLYSAVLSITKRNPDRYNKAREFKRWITGTVIPSIRKDGAYIQGEEKFKNNELSEEEFILQAMTILQSKVERLKKENEIMKPKAEYHDTVLNSDNLLTVSEIAKDLGMSARKLNNILHENGVQFKQSGTWMLYSKYQDLIKDGLCDYKVTEHGQQLKWTEKGRKFIIDLVQKAS